MKPKKRDSFSEINITPLTDIFLVLLIIMMVVAPMLDQQGLNLVVPSNVEQTDQKDPKILKITVTDENTYTIGEESVSTDNLSTYIKEKAPEFQDGVLIQAQENATHGAVVKVMDAARNAGVTSVALSEA